MRMRTLCTLRMVSGLRIGLFLDDQLCIRWVIQRDEGGLAQPLLFSDMQMLRHTKTLGIVQVDEAVWKHLSKEEKAEIEKISDEKLTQYFSRIK